MHLLSIRYPQVDFTFNNVIVRSKDHMNVVGVTFYSKLTWAKHVFKQVNKLSSALHTIKLIRKYFNQEEIIILLTSNFYSILFYNSKVWHILTLKPELKQLFSLPQQKHLNFQRGHLKTLNHLLMYTNHAKKELTLINLLLTNTQSYYKNVQFLLP